MLSSHIAPSESSFTQGQGHRARHQAINSRWASSKAGSVAGGNPATLSQIGAGSEAGDAHRLSGRHSGHISTTSAPGQRVGRTRHRSHEGAAGGITKAKAEEAWGPEEGTSGEVARCSDGAVAARAASDDGAEGTETARSSGKGTKQPNLPTVHSEDEAVGGKKRKGKKKKKKKKVVSEKRGLAWGRKKREAPIVEADEGTEGTGEGTMKTAGQSSGGEVPVEKVRVPGGAAVQEVFGVMGVPGMNASLQSRSCSRVHCAGSELMPIMAWLSRKGLGPQPTRHVPCPSAMRCCARRRRGSETFGGRFLGRRHNDDVFFPRALHATLPSRPAFQTRCHVSFDLHDFMVWLSGIAIWRRGLRGHQAWDRVVGCGAVGARGDAVGALCWHPSCCDG